MENLTFRETECIFAGLENCFFKYRHPSAPWCYKVTDKVYPKRYESDRGFFKCVEEVYDYTTTLNGLLDLSLPSYLAPKYHRMKIKPLSDGENDVLYENYEHFITWYIFYCQTFGLQYLSDIHNFTTSGSCKPLPKNKFEYLQWLDQTLIKKFIDCNTKIVQTIGECTLLRSAPLPIHCAQNATDFLLEPGIIIQLPWNTTIFHQWLVAAMFDVLTFEKHTLELRHWPIPLLILDVAKDLLFAVKCLKERILLGFLILSHQIQRYPIVDAKHPAWILDHVILPSLPTLEFIKCSGIGHKILQTIKIKSWSNSESSASNLEYVPPSCYTVNKDLHECFENCCYGEIYWHVWVPTGLFHYDDKCLNFDIESLVHSIDTATSINEETNKTLSCIEEFYVGLVLLNKTSEKNMLVTAIQVIQSEIIEKNRIPLNSKGEALELFLSSYRNHEIHNNGDVDKNNTRITAIHCSIQIILKKFLCEHDKEISIMKKLVLLGMQVTEREQIIRITDMICCQLGITPIDINVKKFKLKPLDLASMRNAIQNLKVIKRDRDWLWRQFPSEYNKSVEHDTQTIKNKDIKSIINNCECRVGRLVLNIAKKCFEIYENGGEIFQHWMTVQYILPCFIARCANHINKGSRSPFVWKEKIIEFLHGILNYYEKSYFLWKTNNEKRKNCNIKSQNSKDAVLDSWQIFYKLLHYQKESILLLNCHIFQLPGSMISKLGAFFDLPVVVWFATVDKRLAESEGLEYHKIWMLKGLDVLKAVYNVCIDIWKYPNTDNLLLLDTYSNLFEVNELMKHLYNCMFCIVINGVEDSLSLDEKIKVNGIIDDLVDNNDDYLFVWRIYFALTIIRTRTENITEKTYNTIYDDGKSFLLKFFKLIKSLKKYYPCFKIQQLHYLPSLTEKEQKLQKYFEFDDFKSIESMLSCLFVPIRKLNINLSSSNNECRKQLDKKRKQFTATPHTNITVNFQMPSTSRTDVNSSMISIVTSQQNKKYKKRRNRRKNQTIVEMRTPIREETNHDKTLKQTILDEVPGPSSRTTQKYANTRIDNNAIDVVDGNSVCDGNFDNQIEDVANKVSSEENRSNGEIGHERVSEVNDPIKNQETVVALEVNNAHIQKLEETYAKEMLSKDEGKEKANSKICRNCLKLESSSCVFIVCKKCVLQNYPDVNYFCSIECEGAWWEIEHMAEHLEFDLGLLDLSKFE